LDIASDHMQRSQLPLAHWPLRLIGAIVRKKANCFETLVEKLGECAVLGLVCACMHMNTDQFFTEMWTGIHDVPSTTHLGRALPDDKSQSPTASKYLPQQKHALLPSGPDPRISHGEANGFLSGYCQNTCLCSSSAVDVLWKKSCVSMSSTERILEPLDVNGALNSRPESTLRQHGIRTVFWIFVRSRLGSYDITRGCGSGALCKRAPRERLAAFVAVEFFCAAATPSCLARAACTKCSLCFSSHHGSVRRLFFAALNCC